jgi:hypothetical protein
VTLKAGEGLVVDVVELPKSRREVRITANDFGFTRVTLTAGMLGTPDGDAVIAAAADRRERAYSRKRNKPTPGRAD